MAQKESQHREVVEELNADLAQTKRQLDELTALSRDQVRILHSKTFSCFDTFLGFKHVSGTRGTAEEVYV